MKNKGNEVFVFHTSIVNFLNCQVELKEFHKVDSNKDIYNFLF